MTPRKIEFPRIVIVGSGATDQIVDVVSEVSQGKNVLITAGPQTMQIAGNKVKGLLEKAGYKVFHQNSVVADEKTVSDAQNQIKVKKANIALGVGGGTSIDVAKLSSARENIPFISVPTAASHDGISSPIASIKQGGKTGYSFKSYPAMAPISIIADTSIIATAPIKMLAAGCGDLLANYTAVEDWKLAHKLRGEYYGEYAAALSIMSAKMILDNFELLKNPDENAVKLVVEALISSGAAMCITGNSRPCSGAEHMFSHALDKLSSKHGLHGEQCGLGTIMMAYMHKLEWEKFRDSLKAVGAPTTAADLGIDPELVVKALTISHTIRDRYTILGEKGLSEDAARDLAKKTGVI